MRRRHERRRAERWRDAERRRLDLDVGGRDPWADSWMFDDDALVDLEAMHDAALQGSALEYAELHDATLPDAA